MDDLSFVRERIESYADYTNRDVRRLADEQVRAYVGEALSRMHERLPDADPAGEIMQRVLLRCQFADQLVVRALDADRDTAQIAAIRGADRALLELAERADTTEAAAVGPYLEQVEASLDARARLITGQTPATQPPR